MQFTKKRCLSVLAGLLIAAPIWAAHTNTIDWNLTTSTTIGGTEVKPGQYVIRIEDGATQAQVMAKGKVVAEVPVQWTQLNEKARASEVDIDNGKVTQIKIGGKTSAASFKD